MVEKKDDPRDFIIPCTIGSLNFIREFYELGASIILMSLVVYRQLGLL